MMPLYLSVNISNSRTRQGPQIEVCDFLQIFSIFCLSDKITSNGILGKIKQIRSNFDHPPSFWYFSQVRQKFKSTSTTNFTHFALALIICTKFTCFSVSKQLMYAI